MVSFVQVLRFYVMDRLFNAVNDYQILHRKLVVHKMSDLLLDKPAGQQKVRGFPECLRLAGNLIAAASDADVIALQFQAVFVNFGDIHIKSALAVDFDALNEVVADSLENFFTLRLKRRVHGLYIFKGDINLHHILARVLHAAIQIPRGLLVRVTA